MMIKGLTLMRERAPVNDERPYPLRSGSISRPLLQVNNLFRYNHNSVEDCIWSFGNGNFRLDAVGEFWFQSSWRVTEDIPGEAGAPVFGIKHDRHFEIIAFIADESWATYSDARYKFMIMGNANALGSMLAGTLEALRECPHTYAPAEFSCEALRPRFPQTVPLDGRLRPNLMITVWARTQATAEKLLLNRRSLLRSLVSSGATSAAAYRVREMEIV
jgi:hypothetical protein